METYDLVMAVAAPEQRDYPRLPEIQEKCLALAQVIEDLDEIDKTIVTLRLEGLTQEEVGDELGMTQQNVAYHLAMLKPRIKRVLETR